MKSLLKNIRTYFALLVVIAVFAWSALTILSRHAVEYGNDTIVMHLGHWQLEPGARKGIDALAAEYEKVYAKRWAEGAKDIEGRPLKERYPDKPHVKIIQDAVPEAFYGQWVSTQLMGNQAPDIMEVGLGGQGLIRSVWISYLGRYFLPLSPYVGMPNPHNENTDLKTMPFRQTYLDGMRGGYVDELQGFYGIPVAQFCVRIFYNKPLLKKLTGLDEPPTEYRAFMKMCDKIKSQEFAPGKAYSPIASSGYHTWMWEQKVVDLVTPQIVRDVDTNFDGLSTPDEFWVNLDADKVSFEMPAYQARLRMLRELCGQFQNGFAGLVRDDAVFMFAQQRAVFISTGTWDARSLLEQAHGVFEVGLTDFPIAADDDPEFGRFMEGKRYDSPLTGAVFGITRGSKYPEVALDFMLFVASQKGNEQFNEDFGWVPAIKGSKPPKDLAGFEAHFDGVQIIDNTVIGGATWTAWDQEMVKFRTDPTITPQQVAAILDKRFRTDCDKDWKENQMQSRRRDRVSMEVVLTGMRNQAFEARASEQKAADPKEKERFAKREESEWVKYRVLTTTQQINVDLNTARQLALYKKRWVPFDRGLTDYTPLAVENIRKNTQAPAVPSPERKLGGTVSDPKPEATP
jgi:raffinose/stachyose/melibiose transport system substrate-binding protein